MHRLFVAIRPPRTVRAHLLALAGGWPGARWQDDDQLHLTLRFIGEVDRHRADDIAAALGTVRAAALDLQLGALGLFDRRGRPDSLWIGVGPQAPLERLHDKIDQALVRTGLDPERRKFLPHITLARFGRGASAPFALPPDPPTMRFAADHVCLYESHLGHSGAAYEAVARYPLGSEPPASLRASAAVPAVTSAHVSSNPRSSP